MPSPFPGMNPYLEQEDIWHDFHERFLPAAATSLVSQIRPKYIVLIDENVHLHDIPTAERPPLLQPDLDVESLPYLKILDRVSRELITVVELLSQTNKRAGDHRVQYLSQLAIVL